MLRVLTAGESHGQGLTAILEGLPANIEISTAEINSELKRRQQGYGRGGRQKIESDTVKVLSGIRQGKTIGSPITLFIENKDFKNWQQIMSADKTKTKQTKTTNLRPGHADYAGLIKYQQTDLRNILERASARSTAANVAVGALCKKFLKYFDIVVQSKIISVEKIAVNSTALTTAAKQKIDEAKNNGDSLGGIFEITVKNPPIGLGAHVQNDRKLDARIAAALIGLQAIKGVEFGLGFAAANLPGSLVHDELGIKNKTIYHKTNYAGGLEGGMSNGEDIVVRAAMKPIPTMTKPLKSINWQTKKESTAHIERSDVCAIESAAVIGEALVAFEIANALLEKFGGDSLSETLGNFKRKR